MSFVKRLKYFSHSSRRMWMCEQMSFGTAPNTYGLIFENTQKYAWFTKMGAWYVPQTRNGRWYSYSSLI